MAPVEQFLDPGSLSGFPKLSQCTVARPAAAVIVLPLFSWLPPPSSGFSRVSTVSGSTVARPAAAVIGAFNFFSSRRLPPPITLMYTESTGYVAKKVLAAHTTI